MSSFSVLSSSFSSSFTQPRRPTTVSSDDLLSVLEKDRWRTFFHDAQRQPDSAGNSSRSSIAGASSATLRNLLEVRGTRVFFWEQQRNAVVVTNVQDRCTQSINQSRPSHLKSELELDRITILECDIPPLFEVTSIAVSPEGSSVALVGPKGVSVVDMGPEDLLPESGRKIARCIAISERFFLNNPKITVAQCEWFPFRETHIVLLTSDSNIRFYRISSPSQPSLVVNLHGSTTRRSLHSFTAFTMAQSAAISRPTLSIASPQRGGAAATVYALKSDGNVWTFDVTSESERTIASALRGPLLVNAPFASDMSQMATSILFIDASLPVLLIASNRQRIIHGILVEKDDIEIDSDVHASGVIPSRVEFLEIERLELSSASTDMSSRKPSGPSKLFSCADFPSCYLFATEQQLLGIRLPWLEDLELLVSELIDVASLRQSSVQTVLSLDPFADSGSIGLIGSRIIPTDLLDCSVLSVASNGQVTLQKLIHSAAAGNGGSADLSRSRFSLSGSRDLTRRQKPANEVPFDEYIESLLRRDKSLPAFTYTSPDQFSAEELMRMAAQGIHVFQEQYLTKQRQAYEEILNRKARNAARKAELFDLVGEMEQRLADLEGQFQQYSRRSEEADLDALDTHNRISSLQEEFAQFNPVLSDAERQLQEDLASVETRTDAAEEVIDKVAGKMDHRERRLLAAEEAGGKISSDGKTSSDGKVSSATFTVTAELRHLEDLRKRVKDLTDKLQL